MLNKAESETNRDRGMARAVEHADAVELSWSDRALSCIRKYPESRFMAEDVRTWAYNEGLPEPPHDRAWGAVMTKARVMGIISHAGYDNVKNPKAHSTPASVWEKR